ncbi:MAG: CHAP domain-containing protein [Clostridia bacterium]|nr:CHAP domain-containing protein [Clostridia bacterium]
MDQQEQNQSQGFMKEQLNKGKEMAKDQVKKAANKKKKQLLIKILLNPITWKILAVVGIVIGGTILITGLIDVIGDATQNETNEAKKGAVSVSMSSPSSGENTNNTAIVIKPTQNNDSYEITTTYDDENIDDIRKELDEKYSNDLSDFNDFDTKVITGLEENGLDLDSYTTEELKCLPQFLKAESCTQFLDLRPNSQKFDSSGKYKPKQMSELGENEVPGIILVQRTNTRDTNPVTLEYKKLEEFNTLVSNNDINVKNYFTINEKGNLVIAKWDNVTVTVNGNFPQEVPTEERVQNRNENIISTTEIPYSQYVEKFTMPFDFLTQLLVITEDPKFCLEVADIVLGSKIVINIQEEETITTDVESRTYDIHSREEKYINYEVAPSIESQTDYFINLTKDDEENECTTYKNEKTDVTITTVYTSHTYSFEITESDTWIAHYKKTYAKQEKQPLPETTSNIDSKGEYEAGEEVIITDSAEILNDNEAKKLKADKETYYKNKIQTPRVTVLDKSSFGKNYKQISITPSGKFKTNLSTLEYEEQKVVNEDETETITYNMPYSFTATTIKTSEVPAEISFTFRLNSNYTYSLLSNTKDSIKCNISKLRIIPYSKINLISTIKTNVTKYPSDPNPVTNTHIYAKDGSGNFEKFLLAYDNNKKAVELMRDVDSWLFEMMEENQNTINLIDTIKYLLYMYDGTDYGVTELNLEGFFATNMNNASSGTSMQQFLQFLHSWEGGGTVYKDENGVDCYKVQSDGGGGSAVGYGVDIATHGEELRALGYDTSIGALIPTEIVDEIEKEAVASFLERVKAETAGLNLTEYQIYALTSRCYNYGIAGGLKQATSYFKYPSNETFVSAYNKYYSDINNEEYFGDYTKTDFTNELFTEYMTWLDYASSGTHPSGWEYRRKSEWSLFQTGYYGYDLKHGTGHGMDEYYTPVGAVTDFTNNINLYNDDGSVNKDAIDQLNSWITTDLLNTKIHNKTSEMQGGPFAKWWDANNNWFTSAGYRFQCTWYVYGRASQYLEMFGSKYTSWPGTKNNAVNWYYASTNGGEKYFECGSTPRANSIAVWKNGDKAGHVAYVEAVDTVNNKVYISHAGGGRSWFGVQGKGIDEMKTLYGYQLLGYVYLDSPK